MGALRYSQSMHVHACVCVCLCTCACVCACACACVCLSFTLEYKAGHLSTINVIVVIMERNALASSNESA